MKSTRWWLIAAMTLTLIVAGCGGATPDDSGGPGNPASAGAPANPSARPQDADPVVMADRAGLPTEWVAPIDELRCTDPTVGEFPRTVVHDGGETTIDAPPQRVVSIEGTSSLDLLLLLGIRPVAAGGDHEGPAVSAQQAYLTGGTPTDPGYDLFVKTPEINVEQIAAARPDLVISQSGWLEGIEDEINALGVPVIVFEWGASGQPPDWRRTVEIVATAVGRDTCVDDIVEVVEDGFVRTRSVLEASGAAEDTWGAFYATDGYRSYFGVDDPIGQVLTDELGLSMSPDDGGQTEFSLEATSQVLTADRLLALEFVRDGELEGLLDEPVAASVRDRVTVLDPQTAGAAYYPSALGLHLFSHYLRTEFGG